MLGENPRNVSKAPFLPTAKKYISLYFGSEI